MAGFTLFVKKAASWALRQICNRSPELNCKAIRGWPVSGGELKERPAG